jgi:hypothetical protein
MEVQRPSEGVIGSCDSIPMWVMVVARYLCYFRWSQRNCQISKYQREALVIIRRSEWYKCGWICTETMRSIYWHDWKGSETREVREWMDIPLHHPLFKGVASRHARISMRLPDLLEWKGWCWRWPHRYALGTIPTHRPKQAEGFRCILVKLQKCWWLPRIYKADDSSHIQTRRLSALHSTASNAHNA